MSDASSAAPAAFARRLALACGGMVAALNALVLIADGDWGSPGSPCCRRVRGHVLQCGARVRRNRPRAHVPDVAAQPLPIVASYTELLASRYRGRLDERADKYIGYVLEGASRMQRLMRELLNFTRVGTQTRLSAPVDPNAVAGHVLRDLQALIESAGAEVVVPPLPTVLGDDIQPGQVLQNLRGNAIKFRAERRPRVALDAVREGSAWRISVADNGIGIDPKFRDRVIDVFRGCTTAPRTTAPA